MHIQSINNINYKGTIKLKNISLDKLHTYDAIKKIADDKNIDVFITKNNNSKFLPLEDFYAIWVKNNTEDINKLKLGSDCAIINKRVSEEEASVKIYNTVMKAVENLEKKLAKIRLK